MLSTIFVSKIFQFTGVLLIINLNHIFLNYLGSRGTSNFSLEKCVPSLSKTSIPENLLKDRG